MSKPKASFSPEDKAFMQMAIEEARKGLAEGEVPVGTIITRGDEIIARGHSKDQATRNIFSHAEIIALQSVRNQIGRNHHLKDYTLYSSFEPCHLCSSSIFQADIGRVVFATNRSNFPEIFSPKNLDIHGLAQHQKKPPIIESGCLETEAQKLFETVTRNLETGEVSIQSAQSPVFDFEIVPIPEEELEYLGGVSG